MRASIACGGTGRCSFCCCGARRTTLSWLRGVLQSVIAEGGFCREERQTSSCSQGSTSCCAASAVCAGLLRLRSSSVFLA